MTFINIFLSCLRMLTFASEKQNTAESRVCSLTYVKLKTGTDDGAVLKVGRYYQYDSHSS